MTKHFPIVIIVDSYFSFVWWIFYVSTVIESFYVFIKMKFTLIYFVIFKEIKKVN